MYVWGMSTSEGRNLCSACGPSTVWAVDNVLAARRLWRSHLVHAPLNHIQRESETVRIVHLGEVDAPWVGQIEGGDADLLGAALAHGDDGRPRSTASASGEPVPRCGRR